MGMYTEIIFGARIRNDPDVVMALQAMIDGWTYFSQPDHPFFRKPRARQLLPTGSSYSFAGHVPARFEYDDIDDGYELHFRGNFKNYDGEIEAFLDWIKPYITQGSGTRDFYAIVTYEEDETPTIYYLENAE